MNKTILKDALLRAYLESQFDALLEKKWASILPAHASTAREKDLPSDSLCRSIIARYTAAFMGTFQAWVGVTHQFARHERTRCATADNGRCESQEDHIGLLYDFAHHCNALPDPSAYRHIAQHWQYVRNLFRHPAQIGIFGLSCLATLELASAKFMPVLRAIATQLECQDFKYCDVHGEADSAHADALLDALDDEGDSGYEHPTYFVQVAHGHTMKLLKQIFLNVE
jgi:hypothetical protein